MGTPIVDKKNYSDQIFDYLFNEIKSGNMKPGDKLPNERELAQELGVSRPSLREALRAMSSLGLVTTRQGGGSYINEYDDVYLKSILQYMTVISTDLIFDLMQVRKALEAEAAMLAAGNATEEQLEEISRYAEERTKLYDENKDDLSKVREELNRLDYLFHKTIAEASGNRVIGAFITTIHTTITAHQNRASSKAMLGQIVNESHRDIVAALRRRDEVQAKEMMYRHLQTVEDALAL